jgi:excisionase family DNA binding protein
MTETPAGVSASVPAPPLLVTIADACQQLQVSRWMLYQLLDRGDLASVKFERSRRIPQTEINRLIARRLQGGDGA